MGLSRCMLRMYAKTSIVNIPLNYNCFKNVLWLPVELLWRRKSENSVWTKLSLFAFHCCFVWAMWVLIFFFCPVTNTYSRSDDYHILTGFNPPFMVRSNLLYDLPFYPGCSSFVYKSVRRICYLIKIPSIR